jgi:hypothetical protein
MNGYSAAGAIDRQPDLLARLQNVVRQLNRSDIRTVSVLIAKALGDQNAALMCVRLLHWFPRAKKAGGWVYKSWRDWNAECNLSQSQVKRVHLKGFLEAIGIERKTMKANGTPTVHYRLDETQLVNKLAAFLDVQALQIQLWMSSETPNENSQSHPSHQADSDQLNERNQTHSLGEDAPMNTAENAQSITDSHLQLRQQNNRQTTQHNHFSVAVVSDENHDKKKVLQSLEKLGVNAFSAKQLIEKHGEKRIAEVIEHTIARKSANPAGYVIQALKDQWILCSKPPHTDYAYQNGQDYITGPFADFIEH